MPSNLWKRRKDAKGITKSKENVIEQTGHGLSHKTVDSFDTQTLGRKCKSIAKKLIKSVSSGGLNRDTAGSSSKYNGGSLCSSSSRKSFHKYECINFGTDNKDDKPLSFLKGEVFKEYSSWEAIRDDVDMNIRSSFDIRSKYDGARPVEAYPPKQDYYYVEGYGLVSEKFLPDFKRLESNGLLDYGKKYNLTNTRAKSLMHMHRDVDSKDRIKNQNIVKAYNDLKKELDDIKRKKEKDAPLPQPTTNLRSKSVAFIDKLSDDDSTACPNCKNCNSTYDEIHMYKNIDVVMRKPSDQQPGLIRFQSQDHTMKPTDFKADQWKRTNSDFGKRGILRSRSYDENLDKTDQTVCKSKDHVYQNFDVSQVEMRGVQREVNGNANVTESIMYVNTFYYHPFGSKTVSSKSYDIKTNESKWKMDYLFDSNSGNKNGKVINRSQSLRLNLDRTETLICNNHYYG